MIATAIWTMVDVLTGKQRTGGELVASDAEALQFTWQEGNGACDRSRAAYFYGRAEAATPPLAEGTCCAAGPNGGRRFVLVGLTLDGVPVELWPER